MTEGLHLARAPIVEAILDINCDLPPATDFASLEERAKQALHDSYPNTRRQIAQRQEFRAPAESSDVAGLQQVAGLQFLAEDGKQIVQFRAEGYAFNRLAPYGSLDDYLGDIEWSWNIFRELARPVQIRSVALRYINRIPLPAFAGYADLNRYLRVSPLPPERETLAFVGFLNQNSAVEIGTGNQVNITLAMESLDEEKVTILLDIETVDQRARVPENWQDVREAILSLRRLKNRVFERTLTEACLNLFRQP